MFVFGIDIPLPEILFIALVLLLAAVIFTVIWMRNMNKHMKVLENTTLEIRRYEQQEIDQVKRFELDMQKLEADEAELFVGRVVPTVAKLENYVAVELMKNRSPEEVRGAIVKKGISADLATRVVNNMAYYLTAFNKMPARKVLAHHSTVKQLRIDLPKKSRLPDKK